MRRATDTRPARQTNRQLRLFRPSRRLPPPYRERGLQHIEHLRSVIDKAGTPEPSTPPLRTEQGMHPFDTDGIDTDAVDTEKDQLDGRPRPPAPTRRAA